MTSLVYYQPWSLMEQLHHNMNQIFNKRSDVSEPAVTDGPAWVPSVDLHEEDNRFVLRADVPGVAVKSIDITAENGALVIRGERSAQARVKSDGFEHVERVSGAFLRRFTLPDSVQTETIKASYVDGVLEIEIPKQPRVEAKRIPVTVN